jgi:antirestriction protein ArdC
MTDFVKRDMYAEVSARIAAELENGAVPWVKPWRATAGKNQPANAVTGRPYSGCNVVLLWMASAAANWDRPAFLTYKQAQELGGNVRKGEKGTTVFFVKRLIVKDRDAPEGSDETKTIPMMKQYTVFNVGQCDGLPEKITTPATVAPRNTDSRDEIADAFIRTTLADVREGHGEAYYLPGADYVSLPAFTTFKSADHFYSVAFHEMGHWTGAKHRLARDLGNRFGSRAYAAEDLVAELTAAFLCAEFGFDGDLRHAGYIATWAKLLRDDSRAFFTASAKAQQAADHMRSLAIAEPAQQIAEPVAMAA